MPNYLIPTSATLLIEATSEAAAHAWAQVLPSTITLNGVTAILTVINPVRYRRCRFCGCTDDDACLLGRTAGALLPVCAWIDEHQDVCTNPSCLEKLEVGADAIRE